MWNIADRVVTPKGDEGWVANNDNPYAIVVQRKIDDSIFSETFPAEKLKPAPKRDKKELTEKAATVIRGKIEDGAKPFSRGSAQKTVRTDKSGKATLQDASENEKQRG